MHRLFRQNTLTNLRMIREQVRILVIGSVDGTCSDFLNFDLELDKNEHEKG